jgi:hypothetical protein
MPEVVPHNKFAMTLIKVHASNVALKNVLQNSHRFACLRIPHFD